MKQSRKKRVLALLMAALMASSAVGIGTTVMAAETPHVHEASTVLYDESDEEIQQLVDAIKETLEELPSVEEFSEMEYWRKDDYLYLYVDMYGYLPDVLQSASDTVKAQLDLTHYNQLVEIYKETLKTQAEADITEELEWFELAKEDESVLFNRLADNWDGYTSWFLWIDRAIEWDVTPDNYDAFLAMKQALENYFKELMEKYLANLPESFEAYSALEKNSPDRIPIEYAYSNVQSLLDHVYLTEEAREEFALDKYNAMQQGFRQEKADNMAALVKKLPTAADEFETFLKAADLQTLYDIESLYYDVKNENDWELPENPEDLQLDYSDLHTWTSEDRTKVSIMVRYFDQNADALWERINEVRTNEGIQQFTAAIAEYATLDAFRAMTQEEQEIACQALTEKLSYIRDDLSLSSGEAVAKSPIFQQAYQKLHEMRKIANPEYECSHGYSQCWYYIVTEGTPSCTETATVHEYCMACDTTMYSYVSGGEHMQPNWIWEDASCTEPYYEITVCESCGEEISRVEGLPLGHSYILYEEQLPTCVTPGYMLYQCQNYDKNGEQCEEVKRVELPATGKHEYSYEYQAPTCTEHGKEIYTCNDCDNTVEQILPMFDHNWEYSPSTVDATCTEEGYQEATCTTCAATERIIVEPAKGHTINQHEDRTTIKEATCGENEIARGTCITCGATDVEGVVESTATGTGHNFVTVPAREANCVQTGYNEHRACSVCGALESGDYYPEGYQEVQWDNHSFTNYVPDNNGSCYYSGTKTATCDVDGCDATDTIYNEDPAAIQHAMVAEIAEVPATCVTSGTTAGKYCYYCNQTIEGLEKIPVTEHQFEDYIVITQANCGQNAIEKGICKVCGEQEIREVPNSAKEHGDWIEYVTEEATCTESGRREITCGRCYNEWYFEEIPATGHTHTKTVTLERVEATHEEDGYVVTVTHCDDCGSEFDQQTEILKAGHTPVAIGEAKEATCTTPGKTAGTKCSVCNEILTAQEEIPATGHKEVTVKSKAATCTATGLTDGKKCSVCGTVTVAQKTLDKEPHNYDAGKITTAATHDKEGVKTYTCKDCKATKTEKIAKLKTTALNANWATLSKTSVTYTGKAIKPTVTVKNGKTTLKNGTDYTVTYKSNTDVGKATVTITGKGKYSGTMTKTFTITPASMKPNSVKNASNGMQITWKKQPGVDNYVVYRKDSKGKTTTLKTVSGSTTSYTDTTAKSGQKYRYTVRAKEGKTLYGYTWTNAYLRLSNVKVSTASNAVAGVTVKWNKVTGATGYTVYRTDSKGKKTKIYTAKKASVVSYTDKTAKSGQKYTYTVVAYNGKTTSTSTGKAVTRLAAPKITKATNSKKSTVTLQWSKVTGAKKYVVYRKTGNGSYKKLYTTKDATTVKYTDKTAKKGKTYTYAVKAVNGSTTSSYQAKAVKATK